MPFHSIVQTTAPRFLIPLAVTALAAISLLASPALAGSVSCHVGMAEMMVPNKAWEFVALARFEQGAEAGGSCHVVPKEHLTRFEVSGMVGDASQLAATPGIHLYFFADGASYGQSGVEERLDPILGDALERPRLDTDNQRQGSWVSVQYVWQDSVLESGKPNIAFGRVLMNQDSGTLWLMLARPPVEGWSEKDLKALGKAYKGIQTYELVAE